MRRRISFESANLIGSPQDDGGSKCEREDNFKSNYSALPPRNFLPTKNATAPPTVSNATA
jgi:hypothetical protein